MSQKVILFLAALILWCVFTWIPDGAHLLAGIVVASIVGFMMGDLVIQSPHLLGHPRRYVYFIFQYVPVFLWEMLKANIEVAYRVAHPRLPITPGIVKVKTSLQSEIAITLLANSITLTPGTMSVDVEADSGILYIHWIDVRSREIHISTRIIVERFERILRKIFEEGEPDENN